MRAWPGSPHPLGATWDGSGVNFAIFSEHATNVELCLFDSPDAEVERARIPLINRTDLIWHAYVPDLRPGQLYGYRVSGAWDPVAGHRFNPSKVLLDPYARAIGRAPRRHPALLGHAAGTEADGTPDSSDSAPYAPLGLVVDERFTWGDDAAPRTPWHETIIYELSVKGFTALFDTVPAPIRGTYAGLASPPAIAYLQALGVTAVELMPVHARADEWALLDRGLTNYWGYNTLGFFAPELRLAATRDPAGAIVEFKEMVRTLHAAGLEVILDVVYNHTAEGDHLGPTYSLRGIDNWSSYRLDPSHPARYQDFTGCGNTLDARSPSVLRLVMDSLRYWVEVMRVDGFRFDLATALAREHHDVDRLSSFFDIIAQDPVISSVKLIAEPWDLGAGGYYVGNFPPGWSEWNGQYRDAVRRFWRGDAGMLPEMATRLSGSSDLYGASSRHPHASINFVTSHDGFTLADLVSYGQKHNEANGEGGRDGDSHNLSWNGGIEGPTDDPAIKAVRRRQQRNLLVTLLASVGVPMISGGDEVGRSQFGNNNAYCHDSPLSWTPWDHTPDRAELLAFVQSLVALRRSQPALHRRTFLRGGQDGAADVLWVRPDGNQMTNHDWHDRSLHAFAMLLNGHQIHERDRQGTPIAGDSLLVLLNAGPDDVSFVLPAPPPDGPADWTFVVDTVDRPPPATLWPPGASWPLVSQSSAIFRTVQIPR